jgi:hypothetical protein
MGILPKRSTHSLNKAVKAGSSHERDEGLSSISFVLQSLQKAVGWVSPVMRGAQTPMRPLLPLALFRSLGVLGEGRVRVIES